MIFWNSISLVFVSQLGNEDLVSDYIFTSQRESHSVADMGFLLTFIYLFPFGVIENKFTKINVKSFNGNCDYSSCPGWWILFLYAPPHKGLAFWKNDLWASLSFSYSLKITCILLRQVISLKKIVVLSVKYTILISWSPIYNSLILLSALMRLVSTSDTILYNSMESRHTWRTNISIKGSDSRPFKLILDSMLVYATLIMWMDLSPYSNLCKAEKIIIKKNLFDNIIIIMKNNYIIKKIEKFQLCFDTTSINLFWYNKSQSCSFLSQLETTMQWIREFE